MRLHILGLLYLQLIIIKTFLIFKLMKIFFPSLLLPYNTIRVFQIHQWMSISNFRLICSQMSKLQQIMYVSPIPIVFIKSQFFLCQNHCFSANIKTALISLFFNIFGCSFLQWVPFAVLFIVVILNSIYMQHEILAGVSTLSMFVNIYLVLFVMHLSTGHRTLWVKST